MYNKYLKIIIPVVVAVLVTISTNFAAYAAEQYDYVIEKENHIPIPKTYEVKRVIYLGEGEKDSKEYRAEDLFIDKNDNLYVACAGNGKIIKMTKEGNVLGVFAGPNGKDFKNPSGIYVDNDGDMYVADTGNGRIMHLDPKGKSVEQFVKPDSELLGDDVGFEPTKVFISPTGNIYMIKYYQFMSMNANNQFNGYVGATTVGFDFWRMILRAFASKEQKQRIVKKLPDAYSNFVIADDGMIYATVVNAKDAQIRKINSVGMNIYKNPSGDNFYGEKHINPDTDKEELPYFGDIAVDKNGIITVIEQKTGKIYQYDGEGNLLSVFGGKGRWKGVFEAPSSIAVDSAGQIYVLDRQQNSIQVFSPTRFIKLVHEAVFLYSQGEYEKAGDLWQEVLKIDSGYSLARAGLGKVLEKRGDYKAAIKEYRMVEDIKGYSTAFAEVRHENFRRYFGPVVLVIIAAVAVLYISIMKLKHLADNL